MRCYDRHDRSTQHDLNVNLGEACAQAAREAGVVPGGGDEGLVSGLIAATMAAWQTPCCEAALSTALGAQSREEKRAGAMTETLTR
jgi:hypothetical protein